jgi:hypothetical protein
MPDFTLKFDMGNAAFDEQPATECARILRKVAKLVEGGEDGGAIHDINGNLVGRWDVDFTPEGGEDEAGVG